MLLAAASPPTISSMCTTHRRATNGLQAWEGTQVRNMYHVTAPRHHDCTMAPVQHSGTSCHTMQGGGKCKDSAARYKAVLTLSQTNPNCPAWSCWGSARCMRASWRPSSAILIQGRQVWAHVTSMCAPNVRVELLTYPQPALWVEMQQHYSLGCPPATTALQCASPWSQRPCMLRHSITMNEPPPRSAPPPGGPGRGP